MTIGSDSRPAVPRTRTPLREPRQTGTETRRPHRKPRIAGPETPRPRGEPRAANARGQTYEGGTPTGQDRCIYRRKPLMNQEPSRRTSGGANKPPATSPQNDLLHRTVCAVADQCGSCPSINAPYALQLEQKKQAFAQMLAQAELEHTPRMGSFEGSAAHTHYRKTVKLAVASRTHGQKTWVDIGLYKPGSHDVFDLGFCPAQDHHLNMMIQTLRYAIRENQVPVHREEVETFRGRSQTVVRQKGLKYIVARRAHQSSAMSLCLVSTGTIKPRLRLVARQIRQRHPELQLVTWHLNETRGNAIFDFNQKPVEVLIGDAAASFTENIAGLQLTTHPLSFFQVNPEVAERMYRRMGELTQATPLERWVDVYCGVGAIGLSAGASAGEIIGIDETEASVAAARQNALQNGRPQWKGLSGRAEQVLTEDPLFCGQGGLPTGVVSLNPSRRGCQPAVIRAVATMAPHTIVYMSCSQSSLVRDLKLFEEQGYASRLIENFDMFPGTDHYETLVVLKPSRKSDGT
jgi:23S rRNA (uracil1939-C5)-methyltransferase